jgi:murein DD-endopeptidase MepM/ murein hydrolase activator NlpD
MFCRIALLFLVLKVPLAADSPDAVCGPHALITKPDFSLAVKTAWRQAGDNFEITAKNDEKFPVYLEMSMRKLVNLKSEKGKAFLVEVAAQSEVVVNTLSPIKAGAYATFDDYFEPYLHDATRHKPDKKFIYELPYAVGFSPPVLQGYNGKFSHNTVLNIHALDFSMPRGTPILAARAGVVVASRSDVTTGGHDPALLGTVDGGGNFVMVLHDDGTIGNYFHMRCGSIVLKKGDAVKAGDALGEAGSTGYSHPDYPHLHFVVRVPEQKNPYGKKTIPTLFRTRAGVVTLKEGESYEK